MDPTKLVSQFSDFSVIFYIIYKNQQTALTVRVTLLRLGPWEELDVRNVALGAAGRRRLSNSCEAGAALDRGRGRGWLGDHLGPV
jgi:hypothetical protein